MVHKKKGEKVFPSVALHGKQMLNQQVMESPPTRTVMEMHMPDHVQDYFVDGVMDISAVNGVFRITFGRQEKNNALRPVVRILIPANQLGRSLSGISQAANQIAQKIKGETAQKGGAEKDKEAESKKKK